MALVEQQEALTKSAEAVKDSEVARSVSVLRLGCGVV